MQQGMDPNLCEKKEMEEEISPRQKRIQEILIFNATRFYVIWSVVCYESYDLAILLLRFKRSEFERFNQPINKAKLNQRVTLFAA